MILHRDVLAAQLLHRDAIRLTAQLEAYYVRATSIGVAHPKAEEILNEELKRAAAPDAIKTASRRLPLEVFK